MKSLNSFLNPKRKENLKFALSSAFVDEKGNPIEWEMRQLSSAEGMEIQKNMEAKEYAEIMATYIAHALVLPNLKDKELLDGLSERMGRPILKPMEALKALTTDAELAKLISTYTDYNNLTNDFPKKVEEAKN